MGFESIKVPKRGRLSKVFPVGVKAYRSGGRLIVEVRLSDPIAHSLDIGTKYSFCEIRKGLGEDSGKLLLKPVNSFSEWEWHAGNGYVKLVIRGERLGFDAPFPLRAPSYNDVEIEGQKCLVVWL